MGLIWLKLSGLAYKIEGGYAERGTGNEGEEEKEEDIGGDLEREGDGDNSSGKPYQEDGEVCEELLELVFQLSKPRGVRR